MWHVLEGAADLILANAMQVRNLPGRRTDVSDAWWLADLRALGLIRGSVVPATELQDLRDLTRTRTKLLAERARQTKRVQKVLEDANVKLTEIVSDVLGVTGRALVEALIGGEQIDEAFVTACRRGRMKSTTDQMLEAFRGCVRPNHRFLLDRHLRQYDALTRAVAEIERRQESLVEPHRAQFERLPTIPGVRATTALILLAEIGPDLGRSPTSGHLVSWTGPCPANDDTAGKRRSTALRKGRRWLETALIQAARPTPSGPRPSSRDQASGSRELRTRKSRPRSSRASARARRTIGRPRVRSEGKASSRAARAERRKHLVTSEAGAGRSASRATCVSHNRDTIA